MSFRVDNDSQFDALSLFNFNSESFHLDDFDTPSTVTKVSNATKRKFSDVFEMQGSQASRWPQAVSSDFLNLNKVHSDFLSLGQPDPNSEEGRSETNGLQDLFPSFEWENDSLLQSGSNFHSETSSSLSSGLGLEIELPSELAIQNPSGFGEEDPLLSPKNFSDSLVSENRSTPSSWDSQFLSSTFLSGSETADAPLRMAANIALPQAQKTIVSALKSNDPKKTRRKYCSYPPEMEEAVRMVMEGQKQIAVRRHFETLGIKIPKEALSKQVAAARTVEERLLLNQLEIDKQQAVDLVLGGMTEPEVIEFFKQQGKIIPRGTLAERVMQKNASLLEKGKEEDMQIAVLMVMEGQKQTYVRRYFTSLGKRIPKEALSKRVAAARKAANEASS